LGENKGRYKTEQEASLVILSYVKLNCAYLGTGEGIVQIAKCGSSSPLDGKTESPDEKVKSSDIDVGPAVKRASFMGSRRLIC